MATQEQLERALINADKAGDTEAARVLARELRAMREGAQAQPRGTWDAISGKIQPTVLGRMIQGARDPIDAGAQLLPRGLEAITSAGYLFPNPVSEFFGSEARRVDAMNAANEQAYQAAREMGGSTGLDLARGIGNFLSPANMAIATRIAKPAMTVGGLAKTGATAGAVGGAITPINELKPEQSFGATKAAQIGLGAVTGAVASPIIGKVAGAAARYLERKIAGPEIVGARASLETDQAIKTALDDANIRIEDLPSGTLERIRQQVLDALKSGKKLDAAAAMRAQDFKELGMVGPQIGPTKGQLTREPMQFAKEKNLRAVPEIGDPLLARMYNQNRFLADRFKQLGANEAKEAVPAGEMAVRSLERADKEMAAKVSAAYKAARESTGKDVNVPLTGLAQDYADVLRNFGDKVPSGVRNRFEELGLLSGKQKRVFSVEDADQIIKVINDNVTNDPATNTALGRLRDAVKRAVLETGDDAFAEGRALAAKRFSVMDLVPALKSAAEGKLSADDFVGRFVVNGKIKELRAMSSLLDEEARNQMRAQIAESLRRAAFGEGLAGDKAFSPERYAKHLRNIGTEKLRVFFSDGEIETLKRIGRVGAYMNAQPAMSPVLGNPNMFWAGPMMGLIDRIPFVGGAARMTSGAAATGRQAMDVSAALNPALKPLPYVPPNLEPLLPYFGIAGGVGGGLLGAAPLR